MKKFFALALLVVGFLPGQASAAPSSMFLSQPKHIFVNNRILAKVNGQPISVIDVMKQMDMFFYRQFPQYANSVDARYQFYDMSWKKVLEDLIDKELIKADAKEVQLPITHGEVRQEIENIFGPNIIANLDKAGLTYEEAFDLTKEDILFKKMMMARVNSIVLRSVTPQMVVEHYKTWAEKNAKPEKWTYQVISVRGEGEETSQAIANTVHFLVQDKEVELSQLKGLLNPDEYELCSISDEYSLSPNEISESYREILATLKPDTYSEPIAQKSRASKSKVYRIFYLKEIEQGGAPPFYEVQNRLRDQIIDKEMASEQTKYLNRLRKHFKVHIDDVLSSIPDDFKPFSLK